MEREQAGETHNQRYYRLTPETEARDGVEEIIADFEGIVNKYSYPMCLSETEELKALHSFMKSDQYEKSFSPEEKHLSMRAINAVNNGEKWQIGPDAHIDDTGLFAVSLPQAVIEPTLYDALVLSGAAGWHVDHERGDMLDFGKKHGMSARSTYQILGAVASKHMPDTLAGYYSKIEGSVTTEQFVGADMHGDFRAFRALFAHDGIRAPGDETVGFAPILSHENAYGYHSTELYVAKAIILQMKNTLSGEAYDNAAIEVLGRLPQQEGIGSKLFADFGDDRYDWRYDTTQKDVSEGAVLAQFIDSPGERSGITKLVHHKDKLVFAHFTHNNHHIPRSEMPVPNEELADFLVALSESGQSRTSTSAIREIVERSHRDLS